MLAPGLYEAIIEDVAPGTPGQEYIKGRYIIRFEAREVADILALDDGREDEQAFEVVRRVSEINQGIYNRFISPVLQAVSSEASAQCQRQLNPARLERTLISPLNPWLSWLKPAAEYVRAHRHPVSVDNPLWRLQEQWSGWMAQSLDRYRDLRDAATEHCFKAVYESPWLASIVGVQPAREARAPPAATAGRNGNGCNSSAKRWTPPTKPAPWQTASCACSPTWRSAAAS
ncbi:DUF3141 domain-containing protein [Chromobacterium haemolyticum]|nr:DUF3141 domain-containing protein [Chromobacterium haemolyticum]